MIEGEDINFPKRPPEIPAEYHGVAFFVSDNDLKKIGEWIVEKHVADRGLCCDQNGDAVCWDHATWQKNVDNIKSSRDITDRLARAAADWKMKCCRYFFASETDAVEFKLRFG